MFQLFSDGSCDLTADQIARAGVEIVPFYVSLDGNTYQKEAVELRVEDFYAYCSTHPVVYPKTSMPSVQDYIDPFRPYLRRGTDILCYCLTEKFSGSFGSASAAAAMLADEYPDRQIRVVDSTLATGLQGLLLLELARYAKAGHSLEETFRRGEEIKKNSAIFFTIENLDYLSRGGRIGRLVGMTLNGIRMRPIIRFGNGELYPAGIGFGVKNAFAKMVKIIKRAIQSCALNLKQYTFALGWGCGREEGEPLFRQIADLFQSVFGRVPDFVPIQIGATIGVYTGPHPLGFAFIEKA